jgi:hypothetical protein
MLKGMENRYCRFHGSCAFADGIPIDGATQYRVWGSGRCSMLHSFEPKKAFFSQYNNILPGAEFRDFNQFLIEERGNSA